MRFYTFSIPVPKIIPFIASYKKHFVVPFVLKLVPFSSKPFNLVKKNNSIENLI
jgi:hypothetical protein